MSITDKKGINVTSGFKLVSGQPIDARFIADDESDLQSLIDNGAVYEGLEVWVKSLGKKLQYNGTEFVEIATGGASGGSSTKSTKLFTLPAGLTLPEDETDGVHYTLTDETEINNFIEILGKIYNGNIMPLSYKMNVHQVDTSTGTEFYNNLEVPYVGLSINYSPDINSVYYCSLNLKHFNSMNLSTNPESWESLLMGITVQLVLDSYVPIAYHYEIKINMSRYFFTSRYEDSDSGVDIYINYIE